MEIVKDGRKKLFLVLFFVDGWDVVVILSEFHGIFEILEDTSFKC
jgi:hypothetical protein